MDGWYQQLIKPEWAPPTWVFSPVWAVLYVIIVASFGWVLFQTLWRRNWPWHVAVPFLLNIVLNISFTPVQFGLKNLELASVIVVGVLATLVWAMIAVWPYARWVAIVNTPYLVWGAFASVLQLTITFLN